MFRRPSPRTQGTHITTEHNPPLELSKVTVGYGLHPIATAISFVLTAGQSLAVIGANGAGKSTLLRTAAGLQAPLDGAVTHAGNPLDERLAPVRAAIASLVDDDAFFAALSVREHLTLVARGHGVADAATAVARELDFFGLSTHAEALPLTLSSGQRRRLLLAAAFIRPATLLILDEPEQRLDQGMRSRLAARMRQHAASGTAILFATHDADFVRLAADAALVVEEPVRHLSAADGAAAIGAL